LPTANGRQETVAEEVAEEVASPAPAEGAPAEGDGQACLAWENLAAVDADRVNALVTGRFPALTLSRRLASGETGGWWIYIPPLVTKAEADKKALELKRLGITDYFIIQDGPNRFAISLGVFSSEKGGQDRLGELKAKGARSARLMPRPGKDGTISLLAAGPLAAQAELLAALNGNLPVPTAQRCP
jgi:hypothetical protein